MLSKLIVAATLLATLAACTSAQPASPSDVTGSPANTAASPAATN